MDVREVRPRGNRALRQALFDCLPMVGTRALQTRLFSVMRRFADVRMMNAALFEEGAPADIIMLEQEGHHLPVARMTSQYVSAYWRLDPLNPVVDRAVDRYSGPLLVAMEARDVPDPAYRQTFYGGNGLTGRLSLVHLSGRGNIRFNLYMGGRGADEACLEAVSDCSDLLLSIVSAQLAARPRGAGEWQPERVRARLRAVAPLLSAREAEACTGIILGYSSEAIALALGVSIGTVQEFRKRAYRKLGISSQNELMRMVLTIA